MGFRATSGDLGSNFLFLPFLTEICRGSSPHKVIFSPRVPRECELRRTKKIEQSIRILACIPPEALCLSVRSISRLGSFLPWFQFPPPLCHCGSHCPETFLKEDVR